MASSKRDHPFKRTDSAKIAYKYLTHTDERLSQKALKNIFKTPLEKKRSQSNKYIRKINKSKKEEDEVVLDEEDLMENIQDLFDGL